MAPFSGDLWPLSVPHGLSYNGLRARPFSGEEVPEVGDWGGFDLFLRRLSHPDAALGRAAQAGAAAAVADAQWEAEMAPAVVTLVVLAVVSGRRLAQAEEVVVGVELTHVADGFSWRDVT